MSARCKSTFELRDPVRVVAVVRCMLFKGHGGGHLFVQSWSTTATVNESENDA